jgi:hypothetical protein
MKKQRNLMIDTVIDANRGYPELKKRDPELYRKIMERTHAVAECRRRSARSPLLQRKIG